MSLGVLLALALTTARPAETATPADFADSLVATVPGPTALTFTPDGRMLVATQLGQLRVLVNDTLLSAPVVDLAASVCTGEEQGLLGVAVDPSFATNGFVYLYYTDDKAGTCENRVSRFTMSGNSTVPGSELVLIDNIPSPAGNHNAGDLHFGNDGYLYISVGDGGCDYLGDSGCGGANDASRDQNVLLGKILRITRDRRHPGVQSVPGRRHRAMQRHRPHERRATSARRRSPGDCATRSGSRSIRTPRRPASSSTTSARTCGRRSTRVRPAPTTAGTSARASVRTARRRLRTPRPE